MEMERGCQQNDSLADGTSCRHCSMPDAESPSVAPFATACWTCFRSVISAPTRK